MKSKTLLTIQLFCLALFSAKNDCFAQEKSVLVINSDSSVSFYRSSQDSFKKAYNGKADTIDLGEKKWRNVYALQSTLYDIYPDVVYCIGTKAYLLANKFIPEKKIVFSSTASSTSLPQNDNAFGISSRLHSGMELMAFKLIFPEVKKIGIVYSDKFHKEWVRKAEKDAEKMGLSLRKIKCDSVLGMSQDNLNMLDGVDALWLQPDPGAFPDSERLNSVLSYCLEQKIPVFSYTSRLLSHESVVASVSVDSDTIGRQSAILVKRLLVGKSVKEKVNYPAGTEVKLNYRRAQKLGMKVDSQTVFSVNEVVDK